MSGNDNLDARIEIIGAVLAPAYPHIIADYLEDHLTLPVSDAIWTRVACSPPSSCDQSRDSWSTARPRDRRQGQVLEFENANEAWVTAELEKLYQEWLARGADVATIEDHPYNSTTGAHTPNALRMASKICNAMIA